MKNSVNNCNKPYFVTKDTEEERVMNWSSDNKTFTSYSEVTEVINELCKSLHSKCEENLEWKEVILFLIQFK